MKEAGHPAPAFSLDAERSIIGAMLFAREWGEELVARAAELIAPEDFYHEGNRQLFRIMVELADRGVAVDEVTVAEALRDAGALESVGGIAYLGQLFDYALTAANVEHHARIVRDKALLRRLEATATAVIQDVSRGGRDPAELIALLQAQLSELTTTAHDSLPAPTCALHAPPPDPPEWLIRHFATRGDLCLFTADGGVGKSTLALAIAAAVAGGYPVFGHPAFAADRAPVLIVSEEDPDPILRNRLEALIRGHGWERARVLENVHYLALQSASLDSPRWRTHLLQAARTLGAGLVVFDPLTDLTAAKENDNDAFKPLIRYWRKLGAETGAVVLVVHHLGKAGEGKRKIDRIRGASALNAAARMIYYLDVCELGVAVECLKLTKAERLPRFVVTREVDTYRDNPARWQTARLSYLTERAAEEDTAEAHIRRQLIDGRRMNTTQLKKSAKGTGLSGLDISAGIARMSAAGEIDYELGPRGAKFWGLTTLPSDSAGSTLPTLPNPAGQPQPCPARSTLPTLPRLAGQGREPVSDLASLPFRGGMVGQVGSVNGQHRSAPGENDYEEEWNELQRRARGEVSNR